MRELKITINGLTPLLMHNVESMKQNKGVTTIPAPEVEAEANAYWLDAKHSALCAPARVIHPCLGEAGKAFKVGKTKLNYLIASFSHFAPERISLGKTEYEIDVQTVVVKRARIFRARPLVFPWELTFSFWFDPERFSLQLIRDDFPDVINHAGSVVGIMDKRPQKRGSNGKFYLTRYELCALTPQKPLPRPEMIGFDESKKSVIANDTFPKKRKAA